MKISIRRFLAFCIDYVLIVLYGSLLFFLTKVFKIESLSTLQAQLVGFFSLTLPVFLYFFLTETGKHKASLGKRLLKLRVETPSNYNKTAVFKRNFFKFLPWEVAHAGVHWMYYFSLQNKEAPFWVWVLLISPQIMALIYIISILISRGNSSVYDKIGGTQLLLNSEK